MSVEIYTMGYYIVFIARGIVTCVDWILRAKIKIGERKPLNFIEA